VSAILATLLLTIALYDMRTFRIPNSLCVALAVTGLANATLIGTNRLQWAILAAMVGFVAPWLVGAAYSSVRGRTGLGFGDVKMSAAGATWVGLTGILTAWLWASVLGLIFVLLWWLTGRPLTGSTAIPFGPFLAIGLWAAWITEIGQWI